MNKKKSNNFINNLEKRFKWLVYWMILIILFNTNGISWFFINIRMELKLVRISPSYIFPWNKCIPIHSKTQNNILLYKYINKKVNKLWI